MDRDGYMVNGAGYYLRGWAMDAAGEPDRTRLAPVRVSQLVFNPVPTTEIELAANLPADLEAGESVASQVKVYDSLGRLRTVDLDWTTNGDSTWDLAISVPDDVNDSDRGTVQVAFGQAATVATPDGTIGEFTAATGSLVGSAAVAGEAATLTFTADFGQGAQTLTISLGAFAEARGLTQYAGTEYSVRNLTQNGVPMGAFSSVTTRTNGDVAINYDNGQTRIIGRVPIVAFNDVDKLQRLDGQAFMRTIESGEARVVDPASNGVGKLVVGSVERSNVDIASEFSKLILAQRAYTANTRIVTASDEMLQDTINMRR
jgi:flagellar hook protein FlgE